jgi:hypothetical protein
MSEFKHDPYVNRNREIDESRLRSVAGTMLDFAEVIVDSVKSGAVGAMHIGTTMVHISTDVLRLDRKA